MAKNTMVHMKLSKSSFPPDHELVSETSMKIITWKYYKLFTFFKTFVEKNKTRGIKAMTPMSPTSPLIVCSIHHKAIVRRHTKVTQYCLTVKGSFVGRIALISMSPSPSGDRPGLYETRSNHQIKTMETAETGKATANHEAQSIAGSIAAGAMRFCGDEMGELCPPILAAKAMAS